MEVTYHDSNEFFDNIRKAAGGQTNEDVRTTNLEFNSDQFNFAMLMEEDGESLLNLLHDGEWAVVVRMGLCTIYERDGVRLIHIPRWNNFISHLRIVASVFSKNQ